MQNLDYNNFIEFLSSEFKNKNVTLHNFGGALNISIKEGIIGEYAKKVGLKMEEFKKEAKPIIQVIVNILSNQFEESEDLDSLISHKLSMTAEKIEEFKKLIINSFLTVDVYNRLLFEASAKGKIFTDIDWEINSKLFEKDLKEKVEGINFIKLKFITEDPSEGEKVFNFEIDKEGLKNIISELNTILERL